MVQGTIGDHTGLDRNGGSEKSLAGVAPGLDGSRGEGESLAGLECYGTSCPPSSTKRFFDRGRKEGKGVDDRDRSRARSATAYFAAKQPDLRLAHFPLGGQIQVIPDSHHAQPVVDTSPEKFAGIRLPRGCERAG